MAGIGRISERRQTIARSTRSYNIRFNKSLFRDYLKQECRSWIVQSTAWAIVAAAALVGAFVWNWPLWIFIVLWVLFLLCFVTGAVAVIPDYFDYRRIHLKRPTPASVQLLGCAAMLIPVLIMLLVPLSLVWWLRSRL